MGLRLAWQRTFLADPKVRRNAVRRGLNRAPCFECRKDFRSFGSKEREDAAPHTRPALKFLLALKSIL
jgi:hypothetical protein